MAERGAEREREGPGQPEQGAGRCSAARGKEGEEGRKEREKKRKKERKWEREKKKEGREKGKRREGEICGDPAGGDSDAGRARAAVAAAGRCQA